MHIDSMTRSLTVGGERFDFFSLQSVAAAHGNNLARMPFCLKILLENVLRNVGRHGVTEREVVALLEWDPQGGQPLDVSFHPARILMQDYTGIPALVDLAAMRDAVHQAGGDATRVNPRIPVDLI